MSKQCNTAKEHIASPQSDRPSYFMHIFLFVMTLFSTWFVGAGGLDAAQLFVLSVFINPEALAVFKEAAQNGLMYMASIMSILLCHEMGHYLMARRNRVQASLPYFIPMPFLLFGTFGAVIVMKGRIRSRSALMEVGAAGPLAGMAVALPVLIIGLSLSEVTPIPEGALIEGQSLLYMLIKRIVLGSIPNGMDVMLHPMAWAGWIGLLVTMLNLLPIGQLDGGHIFFALFGKAHEKVSRLFLAGLFILGIGIMAYSTAAAMHLHLEGDALLSRVLTGMNWVVLGFMLLVVFGRKKGRGLSHPPTDDDTLSFKHRLVGIACLVLFVLCFMPVPIRTAI
jgi:membrane-associated protease RseP (regulator of RpoE activity)